MGRKKCQSCTFFSRVDGKCFRSSYGWRGTSISIIISNGNKCGWYSCFLHMHDDRTYFKKLSPQNLASALPLLHVSSPFCSKWRTAGLLTSMLTTLGLRTCCNTTRDPTTMVQWHEHFKSTLLMYLCSYALSCFGICDIFHLWWNVRGLNFVTFYLLATLMKNVDFYQIIIIFL